MLGTEGWISTIFSSYAGWDTWYFRWSFPLWLPSVRIFELPRHRSNQLWLFVLVNCKCSTKNCLDSLYQGWTTATYITFSTLTSCLTSFVGELIEGQATTISFGIVSLLFWFLFIKSTRWHSFEVEEVLLWTAHHIYFTQCLEDRVAILSDETLHIVKFGVSLVLTYQFSACGIVIQIRKDMEVLRAWASILIRKGHMRCRT